MKKSCFVIMAIGDQKDSSGNIIISEKDLKDRYSLLIKDAINKANSNIEVVRADDVAAPGVMSTDIMMRLMMADYVIADVTYPNPNVFYELGLRHACKAGTIIIKENNGNSVPFDISHLRYISYTSDLAGLHDLSSKLKSSFEHFEKNQGITDNQFLDCAKLIKYQYPDFSQSKVSKKDVMLEVFKYPEVFEAIIAQQSGEGDPMEVAKLLVKYPQLAEVFASAFDSNLFE